MNKSDDFSEIKKEKFFTCVAIFVLVLCIIGILATLFNLKGGHGHEHIALHYALLGEGLFLMFITFLYIAQMVKIKIISAEKDQALDWLENRMAAIEAAADGIGIVNPQGILIYMNSALQNIFGIHDDAAPNYIGGEWLNIFSLRGRAELENKILPLLTTDQPWRGTSPVITKNGKVIEAELSLTLMRDGTIIGTMRDITEKQQASAERKVLEQQFYQAQKMEAIGRLAGGIAHDFNNILAAINGYAEFLEEDLKENSREQNYARNILKAGVQAKELVDQMLAFSRQRPSTNEILNLCDPMEETLSMIKASFPKTIELQTDFRDKDLFMQGNATQISQLIINLCVNSRDAMQDDRGLLTLVARRALPEDLEKHNIMAEDLPDASKTPNIYIKNISETKTNLYMGQIARDKDYIKLRITDTGTGMSRTIMDHIFEPFFTTKSIDKGTGLGLSSVHGVVSAHQGAMVIESEVGAGTSFYIFFPASHKHEEEKDIDVFGISQKISATILLVEDQDDVKTMMVQMMERFGFDVDSCATGIEALDYIKTKQGRYDLVVTDHNMPKMTGTELIKQVSVIDPDLPFILVSGYSPEKLQETLKDFPSLKDVLRKPLARNDMHEAIMRVLLEKKGLLDENI